MRKKVVTVRRGEGGASTGPWVRGGMRKGVVDVRMGEDGIRRGGDHKEGRVIMLGRFIRLIVIGVKIQGSLEDGERSRWGGEEKVDGERVDSG